MKKPLTKVPVVNDRQLEFGRRLGLDLTGDTVSVALAKIEDMLSWDFWGGKDLGHPSPKQVALAAQFGYDISTATRRVGSAIIDDLMFQLNCESIDSQSLAPGDIVMNKWDKLGRTQVISSIKEDGTVFFKGGNGLRAWARNLVKVTNA